MLREWSGKDLDSAQSLLYEHFFPCHAVSLPDYLWLRRSRYGFVNRRLSLKINDGQRKGRSQERKAMNDMRVLA